MSIDAVIARSRAPGEFKKRQRFTVARERGILKMREFALADPHYYILELIQAAVLNGARYVDISVREDEIQLSYFGGSFEREELAQLFDFLFSESGDVATADVRSLAVGLNALMLFEPDLIVIESGDGTAAGSTRAEIRRERGTIDLGQPAAPLRGTYLRAEGMTRTKVRERSRENTEQTVIEQRCMAAPVPIVFNDRALFGYRSMRSPVLFQYDRQRHFDDGDLYGTLGLCTHAPRGSFRLLTAGVWVQTVDNTYFDNPRLGGIVAFDRLRKTADHAGFTEDHVFQQLWTRLLPYARQVESDSEDQGTYRVRRLGEEKELSPVELRKCLADVKHALLVDSQPMTRANIEHLKKLSASVEAPVLVVDSEEASALYKLFPDMRFLPVPRGIPPALDRLLAPPLLPPNGPWWASPIKLAPASLREIAEANRGRRASGFGSAIHEGTVHAVIYSPEHAEHGASLLWVRLTTCGRLAWEGAVPSAHSGLVLDVELPMTTIQPLLDMLYEPRAAAIAIAAHYGPEITRAASEVRAALVMDRVQPDSPAAHMLCGALASNLYVRVTGEGASAHLELTGHGLPEWERYRDATLWTSLAGEPVSFSTLQTWMESCGGILYGAIRGTDILFGAIRGTGGDRSELDPSRILRIDLAQEAALVELLGARSYERLDERPALVSRGALVIRPIAYGLRSYPDAPLLYEGDASALDEAGLHDHLRSLLQRLMARLAQRTGTAERRNILRHLQYAALHQDSRKVFGDAVFADLQAVPLFQVTDEATPGGQAWISAQQLVQRTRDWHVLMMCDGRATEPALDWDVVSTQPESAPECFDHLLVRGAVHVDERPLMMDGFVLHLLRKRFRVRSVVDEADLVSVSETGSTGDIVRSMPVAGEVVRGLLVLPRHSAPTIVVLGTDKCVRRRMVDSAAAFRVSGELFLKSDGPDENALREDVDRSLHAFFSRLLAELPSLDPSDPDYEILARTLLDYAARHAKTGLSPAGVVHTSVFGDLAERILNTPLFPTTSGSIIAGIHLYHRLYDDEQHDPLDVLAPETPDVLRTWASRHVRLAADVGRKENARPSSESQVEEEKLLNQLRSPVHYPFVHKVHAALRNLAADSHVCGGDETPPVFLLLERGQPLSSTTLPPGRKDEISWRRWCEETAVDWSPLWDVEYIHGIGIFLNFQSDLVQAARDDNVGLAWLLLRIYGLINNMLSAVENHHELTFIRRINEALRSPEPFAPADP